MITLKYWAPALIIAGAATLSSAQAEEHWIVRQQATGFEYDTQTRLGSRKGIERQGLISVSRAGDHQVQSYWSPGAYRATVTYDGETIVDGYDLDDVSRISSFRFDKSGSTVFIKTTKGPDAIVELVQDGKVALTWPRLSLTSILSYRKKAMFLAIYKEHHQTTEFWRYKRLENGSLDGEGVKIGQLDGCALLGSKVVKTGIALEAFCDVSRGSDVKFLDFDTGVISDIQVTEKDEFLAFSWAEYDKGSIPVLSIGGNNNGRQFYHAVSGSLLKSLGEPMSYASDEGGKQSWSQTYRTQVLAALYNKTDHALFAALATQAMTNTLDQQNEQLKISDAFNPSCGWASRIYSKDRKSPISFMINQAMISASLINSCKQMGDKCDADLQRRINGNAVCLIRENEKWFVAEKGLYRIPYGAPFRYDGVWAPWNWHMMWSVLLSHVGDEIGDRALKKRAETIITAFVDSWELQENAGNDTQRALWRYWPAPYYKGWKEEDNISVSRPRQKMRDMSKERYEDLNHAGISLLGLSGTGYELNPRFYQAALNQSEHLLQQGTLLARDMDGRGPKSPRWQLGAGWHLFATKRMHDLYAHKIPGSVSSDQHLAYALLYQPQTRFDLQLQLTQCRSGICVEIDQWSYEQPEEFLKNNPLVTIKNRK